jgi:hypothetical protein
MIIIYHNFVVVGPGTLCDSLYRIDLMPSLSHFSSGAHFVNVVVGSKRSKDIEVSSMLCRRSLDHISRPIIERLIKDGILVNLDFYFYFFYFFYFFFSDFDSCGDCVKGKLTSKTRRQKDGRSETVLELIHTDICGPITPTALGNYRYFITFIDDYSRYGHIERIREKSESLEASL